MITKMKEKAIILSVYKIDNFFEQQDEVYDFWGLGFENLVPISGGHKVTLGDLLDLVTEMIDFIEKQNGMEQNL